MQFTSPALVEQVVWNMRLADQPRGTNRAQIDRLFNGNRPWTEAEQTKANIKTNVNWLDAPKMAADARRSYYNAFLKPGNFFTVTLDSGPVYKRNEWGRIITREISKVMKGSLEYLELLRSQFASVVLHGIGPVHWPDKNHWCPEMIGIEDVLVPSNTRLTLKNLDHFAIFRQYTPMELRKMTDGPKVDPGWNMPLVKSALEWADKQTFSNQSYSELYSPEKVEDRFKQDLGFYGTDSVPTIDLWDFYFWDDKKGEAGWRRRMVIDTPMPAEIESKKAMPNKNKMELDHGQWLYNPGERVFADSISQIIHFQFGDCSARAPFKYHTVRSLGWLLYAVCHLQNRLRCKINDHTFENLLQYFRVSGADDHERLTKLDLQNYGIIPDNVQFVQQSERWQVNEGLVMATMTQNRQSMMESASQYHERRDTQSGTEKTATEIMAEVNAANALVGAMLLLSYEYQRFQYREIASRFCQKNSIDPEVRKFRVNVLKAGVPVKMLDANLWNIEPERVLGAGNKVLEVASADKLMEIRPTLDAESQREVEHLYVLANTDNPDLANRLVPLESPRVSDSIHDAQLMLGTLMQGIPVVPKRGLNPSEVIATLIAGMASVMKKIETRGMATADEIIGLRNVAGAIQAHMDMLAEDKGAQEKLREYGDALGKLMNLVNGYAQRLMEQQQQAPPAGGNGEAAKDAAKLQAMQMQAQAKAANTRESHAQRTAQKQLQFEQKFRQDEQKHSAEMNKLLVETQVNAAARGIETASAVRQNRMKSTEES